MTFRSRCIEVQSEDVTESFLKTLFIGSPHNPKWVQSSRMKSRSCGFTKMTSAWTKRRKFSFQKVGSSLRYEKTNFYDSLSSELMNRHRQVWIMFQRLGRMCPLVLLSLGLVYGVDNSEREMPSTVRIILCCVFQVQQVVQEDCQGQKARLPGCHDAGGQASQA